MKKIIYTLVLFALAFARTNAQSNVYVSSSGGSSTTATYTTLSAAFAAIDGGSIHTGTINIRINNNVTETVTARLKGTGSFSKITLSPADTATVTKTISTSTSGIPLFKLTGANCKNVTIDGRPGGVGTSSRLYFQHTNVNTTSNCFLIDSAANLDSILYTTFEAANSVNAVSALLLTTGPAVKNIYFFNNVFTGGFNTVLLSATAATPDSNLVFRYNVIKDFNQIGFYRLAGIKNFILDSNTVMHSSGFTANTTIATQIGIEITTPVASESDVITRNTITGIKNNTAGAATSMLGIRLNIGTTVSPIPIYSVKNNFVILMDSNKYVSSMRGIQFTGAAPANVSLDHNTVRLGGYLAFPLGNASSVVSMGLNKSNSSTSTIFNCRNNIAVNNRTGARDSCWHLGAWMFSNGSVVGTNSINYNFYSATDVYYNGSLFYAGWAGSIYTTYTGSYSLNEANSLFNNSINFVGTTNLHLTGSSIQDANLIGTAVSVTNDIDNDSRNATTPYKGADESTAFLTNDATVTTVYTYGRMAVPFGNPHIISANVKNIGVSSISTLTVYLTVSGANSFTDSVTVTSLAAGAQKIVDFNIHSYSTVGTNTVTVSVSSDQNNANNTKTATLNTTANSYNYGDFSLAPTGGVGFNAVTGDFVARFPSSTSNYINQISVNFSTGNDSVQIGIWSEDTTTKKPGTNVWSSATFKAPPGPVLQVIDVPNIQVTGNFYCGVRQVKTTNIGFSYQTESPIRDSSFFYTSPTGSTSWTDFAASSSPFKFMIEPRVQLQNDIGITQLVSPNTTCTHGTNQTITYRIKNLGYDTVKFASNNVTLHSSCTLPSNSVNTFGNITISSGTLLPNATIDINISTTFDMSSSGNYKFNGYTEYGLDNNAINDSLPQVTINVLSPKSLPFFEDFNSALSLPSGWSISGGFNITAATGAGSSNGLRVPMTTTNNIAIVNLPKVDTLSSNSKIDFDYRVIDATTLAAISLSKQDTIKLQVSTDCGNSFTTIATFDTTHHTPNAGFTTKTVNIGAYSGQKVIFRVLCTSTATTPANYFVDLDNFSIYKPTQMAWVSNAVIQTDFSNVIPNSTNSLVIGLKVTTSGTLNPISASSFSFNSGGTTNLSDIANVKLWYTGNSNVFSTSTQVSSTIGSPGATLIFTPGSPLTLATGINYFWLTYDISSSAIIGNSIDAYCNYVTIGYNHACTPSTVAGSRSIYYCNPVHTNSCGTSNIDGIIFNTLNNTSSGCTGSNGNSFTNNYNSNSLTTTVRANNTYSFSFTNSGIVQNAGLWIDYNRNGIFETSEYTAIGSSIQGNATVNINITIPANISSGITGMRIRTRTTAITSSDACTSFANGETEDYHITLQSPCNWTGAISTLWSNTGNWSSASIPTQNDNIYIPAGTTNSPTINTYAAGKNITFGNGALISFSAGGNLSVFGNWIDSGSTFNTTSGYITFNTPQGVPAMNYFKLQLLGSGTYWLKGNTTMNNNFILGNGTTLQDSGRILITNKDITNNGSIIGSGKVRCSNASGYQTLQGTGSYTNLEINTSASGGARAYSNFTINGTLSLTQGTFLLNPGVTVTVGATGTATGDIATTGGSILGGSSAGNSTLNILGNSSAAQITGLNFSSPGNLYIDRPNGVKLGANSKAYGVLTLNNGFLDLNGFNFTSGLLSLATGDIVTATGTYITNRGNTGALSIVGNSSASSIGSLRLDTMVNLTVQRVAGITLAKDFFTKGLINISKGNIHLNGKIVTLGTTASLSESDGQVFTDNSGYLTTTRSFSSALNGINIAGLNSLITTNNAPGSTILTRGHTKQTSGTGSSVKRYFSFQPTNYSGLISSITIIVDSTELDGASWSKLRLNKSVNGGSSWTTVVGGTRSNVVGAKYYISNKNITIPASGAMFTASDSVNTPLSPVFNTDNQSTETTNENIEFGIYPNPFTSGFNISFNSNNENAVTVAITDVSGKTISTRKIQLAKGLNNISIDDLQNKASGLYFISINQNQHFRVVKN